MESLGYLTLVWSAVYVSVIAAGATRITPVLYYLGAGSVMVNFGLLPIESNDFIRGLAEVGIVLIMFALGFEESTSNFLASIKKSWGIAFFGALAPFVTAFAIADYYWANLNISLMCGLTMTATAVSLTMVSLKSEGLARSPVATRIMTSAVLDDIGSLALVAILVPIAAGQVSLGVQSIALTAGKALAFFLLVTVIGAWLFPSNLSGWLSRVPILGKYGIVDVLSHDNGQYAILTVCILALAVGLLAHEFGFHPAVGAYMAGLILKEEYFQRNGTQNSYEETKKTIDIVAFTVIGPVFFVDLGAKLIFDWTIFVSVIPQTFAMVVGLFAAQTVSAGLAARYTSGMNFHESVMVGFGMLGRAELAFVVMDIAYIQNKILTTDVFYTLMFVAFWLNVAVPISISWWKPYLARRESGRDVKN